MSFHWRKAANISVSEHNGRRACLSAARLTSGAEQRTKGFVRRSRSKVEGTVGNPWARRAAVSRMRAAMAVLSGSTARAKARLARVYS